MESLKEEVIRLHECTEHNVLERVSFRVSLLKFSSPREFVACSVETKGNCNLQDTLEIVVCMTEFLKNNPEISPCYFLLDISMTDAFTLKQVSVVADALKDIKSYVVTRLVGSVIRVGDHFSYSNQIAKMLQSVYTPVRPLLWYKDPGDGASFIAEWEEKM